MARLRSSLVRLAWAALPLLTIMLEGGRRW